MLNNKQDSASYLTKKNFFDRILTIYGRKPVLEAVSHPDVEIFRLHLSESNKTAPILKDIMSICEKRKAEIIYHDKKELSRISKNSKQDQGIAVDLKLRNFFSFSELLEESQGSKNTRKTKEYIALDGITNPQNLGMIIRSICASPIEGLILPKNGCARMDALVIKASAGTLFKAKIFRCEKLNEALKSAKDAGFEITALDVNAKESIAETSSQKTSNIYVLGNETHGLSEAVENQCTQFTHIPMSNHVESLNVAVTASLIAFRSVIRV